MSADDMSPRGTLREQMDEGTVSYKSVAYALLAENQQLQDEIARQLQREPYLELTQARAEIQQLRDTLADLCGAVDAVCDSDAFGAESTLEAHARSVGAALCWLLRLIVPPPGQRQARPSHTTARALRAALEAAQAENQQLRDALERIGAWHICETYYPYGAAINMRETARAALAAVRVEEA